MRVNLCKDTGIPRIGPSIVVVGESEDDENWSRAFRRETRIQHLIESRRRMEAKLRAWEPGKARFPEQSDPVD